MQILNNVTVTKLNFFAPTKNSPGFSLSDIYNHFGVN